MMLKAVIFDFDGVIADSHAMINDLFTRVSSQELGITITAAEFARYPGARFEHRLAKILEEKGMKADIQKITEAVNKGRTEYYGASSSIILFKGVHELIKDLKKSGLKIALGTNGSRRAVSRIMEDMKITSYFDSIVTYDDVLHGKPAPDIFLRDAENLKLEPSECLVIGDSVEDIVAAKAAGMKVIAVATTMPRDALQEADLIVKTVADLDARRLIDLYG